MNNSFIKKHKMLSAFFVFGVLAIVGGLTIYQSQAESPNWTQTTWSGGPSDEVIVVDTDLGNFYKEATPHIDFSQEGQIGVSNIISNPGFESDINGWTFPDLSTATHETTTTYSGNGSLKIVISDTAPNFLYQDVEVGTSDSYYLSAYVKNDTSGDGGVVNDTVVNLFFDTANIRTTYGPDLGDGWHRIYSTDPITDDGSEPKRYGVVVTENKTLYLDDFQLVPATNTLTSSIFDMGEAKVWDQLSYSLSGTGTTQVFARTGNLPDMGDAEIFGDPTCTPIAHGTDLSLNACVDDGDRYIQYQVQFLQNTNPPEYQTLDSITIHAYPSTVQFDTPSSEATEADLPLFIPVSLNYELEENATVNYTISGTATNGEDYDPISDSGTITINAGLLSENITINLKGDSLDEENETIIVTLSDPSHTTLGDPIVYTYTIINDDFPPNVFWSVGDEIVDENTAGTITITAQLNGPSGKEITVPFTISGTAVGGGVDYTLDPETPSPLIIPAGDTQASFDINFNNENIYEDDETIIVTIDVGNLINATTSGIDPTEEIITIVNDDTPPEANFNIIGASFSEGEGDIQMDVTFSNPSEDDILLNYRIITTDSGMPSDFVINDACNEMDICSVNVPAGDTTAQFSITLTDDSTPEIAENTTFEIQTDPPFMTAGLLNQYTLTINDDDFPGLNISPLSGDQKTTEGGVSQTFTIELNTEPDGDVVIDLESNNTLEGTIDIPTVTFNNVNWNDPQTITVTGIDDFLDDGDIGYLINITIDNEDIIDPEITTDTTGYAALLEETVSVTNEDNDTLAIIVDPTSLVTNENGSTADFTVVLGTQPDGTVVMNLVSDDLTEGTILPSEITFDDTNWHFPQTLTVTGADDPDQDDDVPYTINIMMSGLSTDTTGYTMLVPADVSVTNMDNDTPGITVSPISGNTTEASDIATFTVVLESQPSADVTIALSSDNEAEGTVSPASLTFTNADWNTPQTVTVTGIDDNIDDDNQSFQINATIGSVDLNYDGMLFVPVDVINEDDDTAGISVSAITGDTNEDGGTATFTIKLNSEPLNQVAIPITSQNADEGTVNPTGVNFNAENWATPQTITVTGVNDNIVDDDIIYIINLLPAISIDPNYAGMDAGDVTVINADNDAIGFMVTQSAGATNVGEGSNTDSYTIRLNTLPSDDVVITITPDAQVTVNPTTLTFTTGNWNTNQTVTVTAVNDTVVEGNHNGIISHNIASTDLEYHGFALGNITAAITDNDTAPRSGGGGGGFWFPSSNPSETPVTPTPATDPQREQRLERLRSMGVAVHGLVKIADDGNPNTTFDNIVYYVGADGKRHVFPNADIYKTWYDSFRYVRIYPMETLSQIPLGGNVRYKPGVKMIKFRSNNRVYAVEAGGKLRWIMNEKVAWYMYGTGWQKQIVNIPDSLFPSYEFADDISHSNQFDFAAEAAQSQNISMELGL